MRSVTTTRLVFTDGERWRLRLLLLPESRRSGCDTLIADFDAGQKSASRRSRLISPSSFPDSFRFADNPPGTVLMWQE
jgi:hypothetical protein